MGAARLSQPPSQANAARIANRYLSARGYGVPDSNREASIGSALTIAATPSSLECDGPSVTQTVTSTDERVQDERTPGSRLLTVGDREPASVVAGIA